MVQVNMIYLKIFFITMLFLQVMFLAKRIIFILSKNEKAAYYHSICFSQSGVMIGCADFLYIVGEIYGSWQEIAELTVNNVIVISLVVIFDLFGTFKLWELTRKLHEVYAVFKPIKKKTIVLDESYIVLYDLLGRKETIYLSQVDIDKSEVIDVKFPAILDFMLHRSYVKLELHDGTSRKIDVKTGIIPPSFGLRSILHLYKRPIKMVLLREEVAQMLKKSSINKLNML